MTSEQRRKWPRLTETSRPFVSFDACQLCGQVGTEPQQLWYECDWNDVPEVARVLVVCRGSKCAKVIDKHPRLYMHVERGDPGHFPLLCGDCKLRSGTGCTHPKLMANGGAGIMITLTGYKGTVCSRGPRGRRCRSLPRPAIACEGRQT